MLDNKQERSRLGCIFLQSYILHWRELLFVTLLGQIQKPLYSNIQWLALFLLIETIKSKYYESVSTISK